jgi:predicted PurR-regulated permease PerM
LISLPSGGDQSGVPTIPFDLAGAVADLFIARKTTGRRVADAPSTGPDLSAVLRIVLVVVGVVGALWLVYALGALIVVLVFCILFAYLVAPLVVVFERRLVVGRGRGEMPRAVAITLAYLLILGALGLLVAWGAAHVSNALGEAPQFMQTASARPFSIVSRWPQYLGVSPSAIDSAVSAVTGALETGVRRSAAALMHTATYLPWLVVIPIVSFFLLEDAELLTQTAIGLLPLHWRVHAHALLDRIDLALAAYIRAQLVACLIVGAIVAAGFTLLRVPLASLLGVAAGLAEFVPLVGPLAIALMSATIAFMHSPIAALWVLLFLGVLRVVEDYVIYPRLVGSTVHLHPLLVVVAVLAGGELGGVIGVVLSVPFLATASAVYRYAVESSPSGTPRIGFERRRAHPSRG